MPRRRAGDSRGQVAPPAHQVDVRLDQARAHRVDGRGRAPECGVPKHVRGVRRHRCHPIKPALHVGVACTRLGAGRMPPVRARQAGREAGRHTGIDICGLAPLRTVNCALSRRDARPHCRHGHRLARQQLVAEGRGVGQGWHSDSSQEGGQAVALQATGAPPPLHPHTHAREAAHARGVAQREEAPPQHHRRQEGLVSEGALHPRSVVEGLRLCSCCCCCHQ